MYILLINIYLCKEFFCLNDVWNVLKCIKYGVKIKKRILWYMKKMLNNIICIF